MSLVSEAPPNFRPGFAQRFSQELKCSGSVPGDARRKATSLKWSKRSRKDMSTSTFTVTLLLLGTIGATQTENPAFWLLIGPAPFAVVLAGLVFFRQRFSPRHRKTSALRPDHHPVNSPEPTSKKGPLKPLQRAACPEIEESGRAGIKQPKRRLLCNVQC